MEREIPHKKGKRVNREMRDIRIKLPQFESVYDKDGEGERRRQI